MYGRILTEQALRDARKPEFWQSVCPDLSITTNPFLNCEPLRTVTPSNISSMARQIANEGYFQLPPIADNERMARLAKCVSRVVKAGFPATFAIVYDALWDLLGSLSSVMAPILGRDYLALPDYWIWHVDARTRTEGWTPHRDDEKGRPCLRPDGTPTLATVWIPFTNACPTNSCIYVLPTHLDPHYPDQLHDVTVPVTALQAIRALPAKAGSLLCWNQYLLHWGSARTPAAKEPRTSIGIYFQSADVPPFDLSVIDLKSPFSFQERLGINARMINKYKHVDAFPSNLLQFCKTQAHFYDVTHSNTLRALALR